MASHLTVTLLQSKVVSVDVLSVAKERKRERKRERERDFEMRMQVAVRRSADTQLLLPVTGWMAQSIASDCVKSERERERERLKLML